MSKNIAAILRSVELAKQQRIKRAKTTAPVPVEPVDEDAESWARLNQFYDDYETFDIFQGLLLPPVGGAHNLLVRLPDGRTQRRRCEPISLAGRRAMMTRVSAESNAPRWKWERRPDGIAVLTMPGWAMWNSKWN